MGMVGIVHCFSSGWPNISRPAVSQGERWARRSPRLDLRFRRHLARGKEFLEDSRGRLEL